MITVLQRTLLSNRVGYSVLFSSPKSASTEELAVAILCLVVYCSWWTIEIIKGFDLLREYREFVKSIEKEPRVNKCLYRLKVLGTTIMVMNIVCMMAGVANNLNFIVVGIATIMRILCAIRFKNLMDLIGINNLEKYGLLKS